MRRFAVVVVLTVLAVAGCNKKKEGAAPADSPAKQGAAAAPAAAPGSAPAASALSGKVAEVLDAPNYTYLRLSTPGGDVWAAIPTTKVAVGEQVTVASPMRMENFQSKTLNRTFDVIMFGAGLAGEGAAGGPGPGKEATGAAMPPGHPAVQGAPSAAGGTAVADVKVEKAPGGSTVAEIFANRAKLKDKQVTVRGKVVKYSSGILGKNWLHLRDGSGTEGVDNDITVTTMDEVAVGDVVLVKGTVHLDRDIGAGYAYPVLIEDAKLSK